MERKKRKKTSSQFQNFKIAPSLQKKKISFFKKMWAFYSQMKEGKEKERERERENV